MNPVCTIVQVFLLFKSGVGELRVVLRKLDIGLKCDGEIQIGGRLLILHSALLRERFFIHKVDLVVEDTVVWQTDWSGKAEVEVGLAFVC